MTFDFRPLLTLQYWFSLFPAPFTPLVIKLLLAGFLILISAGLVLRAVAANKKTEKFRARILRRFTRLFITTGVLGLLLEFFSIERALLLNMKFWYLILLFAFLIWLGFILWDAFAVMPRKRREEEGLGRLKKYLPR